MKKKILFIGLGLIGIAILVVASILIVNGIKEHKKQQEWAKMVAEYRENKRQLYLEENEKYADYEVEVAFLGDSLTDGCDLCLYYPNYVTSNRGIGGDTTTDVLGRLSYSVYDLKPQTIVLLIGGNNLKTMFNDYEDILSDLKENLPDTKVILVSLTAMGLDHKDKNKIAIENNKRIVELATKYNYYYVNVFDDLYNASTGEIYHEYTTDGLHFTNEGYLVVTSIINNKLKEVLGH